MFVLWMLLALQGVFIGGHMVKSSAHDGIENVDEVIPTNARIVMDESSSGQANQDFLRSIAFHPTSVDFGAWSIGTARSYLVTLINKNANKSVHLSSISGNTQEFYSSFFEDKVVPPHGNTTFNVVFLPRYFGAVETDLFIHTSFGQARLPVKGEGKECPYRIKSLVGIKAPFNATISPEIHMYNPHPRPIQILEIYSSGGQFQLELPSGGQEGPQALWEIPSHTTKPIIRIRFHATQPGNHTAFIRIKISESQDQDEENEDNILVIPVEIEISEDTGLYSPNPVLDFGRLTTLDSEKAIKVHLVNSGKHSYQDLEYRVENVDDLIQFNESDLTLHIHPKLAMQDTHLNGQLLVRMWRNAHATNEYKNQQKYVELSMWLRAEIFKGSLEFPENHTIFLTSVKGYQTTVRNFPVHNKFCIPITVVNISVENNDSKIFLIREFKPTTIPPDGVVNIFNIYAVNETGTFKTILRIHTNLSTYELPIIVCSGLLERVVSLDSVNLKPLIEHNTLNFGAIQYGDYSHNGYILLRNRNPISISVVKWNFKRPKMIAYFASFVGCAKLPPGSPLYIENEEKLPLQQKLTFCVNVEPDDVAVFILAVQSPVVKAFTSIFEIWTEYEMIETNVNFEVVMGRLDVDQSRLHFAECFPGKRCSADISIHSTFVRNMQVNSITVSVPGLVFEYHTQSGLPEIVANSITDIGLIHFDPKSVCGKRCYILQDDTGEIALPGSLELDEIELRRRTELFRNFKYNLQMITFTLNTSEVRLYEFNSTVDLVWPKLVRGHQILPTIEIGQNYHGDIFITNPSTKNLRVELELADPRRAKTTSLSLPLEVIDNCGYCYLTDDDVFFLGNGKNDRISLYVKAESTVAIPIRFLGNNPGQFSTLLHVYNNLTLYEAVWITAKAVQPQFRFGNRKSGSATPLLFEISEKHLMNCDKSNNEVTESLIFSTKRSFTARNTGEVPIMVEKFLINDVECEGYGFRVVDCSSFELKANSSRKVDIAFTPDFTMTRISHVFVIKTNLSSDVNYTLLATVPASCLESCSKAFERPFWEGHMKKVSVGVLVVAFIFVLIAACIDSDKVLKDHVQNISKDKGPMQPPLDLRNIGMKQSTIEETASNDDLSTNSAEKNTFKFATPNLKRRNVKRNSFIGSSTAQNISKEKSWAEELARKLRHSSTNSSSSTLSTTMSSPKATILSKAIQTMSSAASVASSLAKPIKDDKPIQNRKSTKETGVKTEASCPVIETRKPKSLVKKSKSVLMETILKENDQPQQPVVTFGAKPYEKSSTRSGKSTIKDKADSQLNISERKSVEATSDMRAPKPDSPTNVERISPRGSTQNKKFGKTPGRERKKDQNNQSSSKRKVPKFKGTAFQFTAPLDGSSSNNSSPTTPSTVSATNSAWETNPAATFSNVVAQRSSPKSDETTKLYSDCGLKPMFNEEDSNNNSHDWNEADLKNHETFGPDAEEKSSLSDLGPIGTKKSPSSTPPWESFMGGNIHRPTASFSSPHASNTSFFSSNFPIGANFDYTNQYLGGTSGLLEHVFEESQQYNSVVSPNDLFLAWLRQERIRQQTAGWTPGTNRTWTPMGYQDDPLPAATAGLPTDQLNNVWQPPTSTGGVVRPPPGLPLRSNRGSPIHHQPQMQTQSQLPPTIPQQVAPQQAGITSSSNTTIDPLQSYHPYTSFNSIWSDAWNKQENK